MRALVFYPGVGSVWLERARYEGEMIIGEAESRVKVDEFSIPEYTTMNFPKFCIRKIEGAQEGHL